jgi:signal transduction histidine kinase
MQRYAAAPEDARQIIQPSASVTELRDAEEALKSLQTQLTQALRQKDRLAALGGAVAKVSHDLRNILTSAQLFVDRIEGSEDPLVRRMAPKLVGSITRAVNLCESTLAFGRVDEPAPTLARFDVAAVINDVVESERLAVGDFDLEFVENVPLGLMVRADSEQLFRVISNLVRNARQAMMGKGVAGSITVSAAEEEDAWRICVTDTGPGLPPKAQEHLFKPFEGGVRKGGSGLGLVIAADLVRGHGGILSLEYTSADGTQFSIRLPNSDLSLQTAAQ